MLYHHNHRYENKGVKWMKNKPSLPVGLSLEEDNTRNKKTTNSNNNTSKLTSVISNNPTEESELTKSMKINIKRRMKKKLKAQNEEENKTEAKSGTEYPLMNISKLKIAECNGEKGEEEGDDESLFI